MGKLVSRELEFIRGLGHHQLFSLIIGVMLLGISINFIIEYNLGGLSEFALRDLSMLMVISTAYGLYLLRKISARNVFVIAVYTIVLAITLSIVLRVQHPDFVFEPYYIKVELILIVMSFTIGVFVQPWHKLIIVVYNILFTLLCAILVNGGYPTSKFFFYVMLVSAAGYFGYVAFKNLLRLNSQIKENNLIITQANKDLKHLNEFKDSLFKIIGHDLRSPIFQIVSLLEILEESKTESERQECLDYMRVAANNANLLLEDLLQWAKERPNDNPGKIVVEEFNIHDLVDKTLRFFKPATAKKRLYMINATEHDQKVAFDAKTMETILRNLISNAIKFSPSGEVVSVISQADDEYIKVSVRNNGESIDSSLLQELETGSPVMGTRGTDNEKGTGSGLGICKRLLDRYKGKLEIRNLENGIMASVYVPKNLDSIGQELALSGIS
ncbi:MAG: sensor histidine kinase [Flavobacteriaceae bacterium]